MIKRTLCAVVLLVMSGSVVLADEVTYSDIAGNPSKYLNKTISVKGSFLFLEAMRESFTIDLNGNQIEVFYSDLPEKDKTFLRSQQQYSKALLGVSGTLKQYTNSARSYFMVATGLRYEQTAHQADHALRLVSYRDILADPAKYLKKSVSMKGTLVYTDRMRQSMGFEQSGNTIEALISDLSKIDREAIFNQKNGASVVVTGDLFAYVNNPGKYYLAATTVVIGK